MARNTEMLEQGQPDEVLAFFGGRGTADCLEKALRIGIPANVWVPNLGLEPATMNHVLMMRSSAPKR